MGRTLGRYKTSHCQQAFDVIHRLLEPNCKHRLMRMQRRGTDQSPKNRFLPLVVQVDEDCHAPDDEVVPGLPILRTEWFEDDSQSIVTENESPDIPFRFSANPYRGCEHGCAYCYARPYHEYLGWNAGIDFESKILVKPNAASLLRRWLSRASWNGRDFISLSGMTDPYQPMERTLKITRSLLEVFVEAQQAVSLITKNALITRDIDLLGQLASFNATCVILSITTLDVELARVLEPRCSIPAARLKAIEKLAHANIPVHVNVAPLIPGLNDHEIPALLSAVASAGARSASWTLLRLPGAVEPIFVDWLEKHRPLAKNKILDRLRGLRDGKLHDPRFGKRMRGEGFFADEFKQLFQLMRAKHGLDRLPKPLDTSHFKPPRDNHGQGYLF